MKFKKGDKVRIKSLDDIRKTLNSLGICGTITFNSREMAKYCGKSATIVDYWKESSYCIEGGGDYVWRWEWLEPYKPVVRLPEDLFTI